MLAGQTPLVHPTAAYSAVAVAMRRLECLGWCLSAVLDRPATDLGGCQRSTEIAKLARCVYYMMYVRGMHA